MTDNISRFLSNYHRFFPRFLFLIFVLLSLPVYQYKETRGKKEMTYVSEKFFDFICILENTFLANANVRMMIAYNEGDLFDAMMIGLKSEKRIVDKFKQMLDLESYKDDAVDKLLDHILTIFKHIRGRWFTTKQKGQKKQISSHSTRKYVQVKTEIAVATADIRSDKSLAKYYNDAYETIHQRNDDEEDNEGD